MKNSNQTHKSCKKDFIVSFSSVLSMVEQGWDITDALKKLGISSSTFYRKITENQKNILNKAKALNTKYGIDSNGTRYIRS